jgi:uncharacterized membrane protein YccF (DUF307 family)
VRVLLNVVWLVFGGLVLALGYAVAGIVCCLLVVTIPFGIASFRIASYAPVQPLSVQPLTTARPALS